MEVDLICDLKQFEKIKNNWNSVYAADKNAIFYVSWIWLRSLFELEWMKKKWFILAIRLNGESQYIGFFPLCHLESATQLAMAGHYLASHTGIICLPEFEKRVLSVLAAHIQNNLYWEQFVVRDTFDPRIENLLQHFISKKYNIEQTDYRKYSQLFLPSAWDEYLQTQLSNNTRKALRKKTRKIEKLDDFHITLANDDNIDLYINDLTPKN